MKKIKLILMGLIVGVINGFLGAGGGIVVVSLLKKISLEEKECHSTSVAIILPLTILSGIFYIKNGVVDFKSVLIYVPFGVIGAVIGGIILPKINDKVLRKAFAFLLLWFGFKGILF